MKAKKKFEPRVKITQEDLDNIKGVLFEALTGPIFLSTIFKDMQAAGFEADKVQWVIVNGIEREVFSLDSELRLSIKWK